MLLSYKRLSISENTRLFIVPLPLTSEDEEYLPIAVNANIQYLHMLATHIPGFPSWESVIANEMGCGMGQGMAALHAMGCRSAECVDINPVAIFKAYEVRNRLGISPEDMTLMIGDGTTHRFQTRGNLSLFFAPEFRYFIKPLTAQTQPETTILDRDPLTGKIGLKTCAVASHKFGGTRYAITYDLEGYRTVGNMLRNLINQTQEGGFICLFHLRKGDALLINLLLKKEHYPAEIIQKKDLALFDDSEHNYFHFHIRYQSIIVLKRTAEDGNG